MDQYCILGRIGEGAHGIVFKAKHVEVSGAVGSPPAAVPGRGTRPPDPPPPPATVSPARVCTAAPASSPCFVVCAHHFGPHQWGPSGLQASHPPARPQQLCRECPRSVA